MTMLLFVSKGNVAFPHFTRDLHKGLFQRNFTLEQLIGTLVGTALHFVILLK